MTGVNFVTGILKNKIYSVYLGVSGLGIISQVSSTVSLLSYLLPLGLPTGITKLVAQYIVKDKSKLNEIIQTAFLILLLPVLISSVAVFFFSNELSIFLFDDASFGNYIKVISIFIPFLVLFNITEALIKGLTDISLYVKSTVISIVGSFIIIIPLVIIFGVTGAIFGMMFNFVIFVIYSFIKIRSLKLISFDISTFRLNTLFLKEILRIGFVLLIAGSMHQLTLIYLKRITIESFGIEGNGLFQSVLSISLFYFGFIFTTLSSYTFPKIAGLTIDSDLTHELNNTIRFIMLIMVPLVLVLVVFRVLIILTLYTSEFLLAEPLFYFQFLGDLFKALSWVLGIWLVPRSKLILFVLFDLIFNLNLIIIYKLLLQNSDVGITSVSVAYLTAYFIHFIINLYASREKIGFRFSVKNLKLILLSIAFLVLGSGISIINLTAGYIMFIPILAIWLILNVSVSEIKAIKLLILNILNSKNTIKHDNEEFR